MPLQSRRGRPSNIAVPPFPEPQIPVLDRNLGPPPSRPPRPSAAQEAIPSARSRSKPASARAVPVANPRQLTKPSIALANETVDNWPLSDDWRQRRAKESPRSVPRPHDRSRLPRPSPPRPPRPEEVQPPYDRDYYVYPDPYAVNSQYYPPPQSFHGSGQWYGDSYGYDYNSYDYSNYDYDHAYDHSSYDWQPQQQASAETYPGHPAFSPPSDPAPPSALPTLPTLPGYSQSQRGNVVNRVPLGPPPSARRGLACYYPEFAPVHPIVEERESVTGSVRNSERKSRNSSKSEHTVSPVATQEGSLVNNSSVSSIGYTAGCSQDIRSSRIQNEKQGEDQETGVVRQASLGKRSRPTLTSVKNGEHPKSPKDARSRSRTVSSPVIESSSLLPPESPKETFLLSGSEATNTSKSGESKEGSPWRPHEVSLPARGEPVIHPGKRVQRPARARRSKEWDAPRTPATDDVSESELAVTLEADTDVGAEIEGPPVRSSSTPSAILANYYSGDVEKRSSILGAPLSSPGAGFSDTARKPRPRPQPLDVAAVREAEARGSLSSLNELIRRATKLRSNLDRGKTASRLGMDWWDEPSADEKRKSNTMSVASMLNAFPPPINTERHSALASDSDTGKELRQQRRRVCGMPLWAFILLLLLILLLVAAAVVIPVTLLVLPSQKNHNSTRDGTQVAMMSCSTQLLCENAGALIVGQNGKCQCLCVNGYTGTTCSTSSPVGCTDYTLADGRKSSIGQTVASVFAAAENMNIPLDAENLSGLFSLSNLSCLAQNALVTFSGAPQRRNTNSTANNDVEFARVAVLYVFQESRNLSEAVTAQQNLQTVFSSKSGERSNATLAGGMSCDLQTETIKKSDGVEVGGRL